MVTLADGIPAAGRIHLNDVKVVPSGPPPEALGRGPHYYLVQFVGPIKPEWLEAIQIHGGTLQNPVPPYAYII
jgi:hypothetical protein